jgi:hypothetical protein
MKKLQNFSNYEIYEDGRIFSVKGQCWLKANTRKEDGYLQVTLINDDGVKKKMYLHRIIALTYLPNPNNLPCVNHKDENKANNNIDNLEWCNYQYNNNYGTKLERGVETRRKNDSYKIPETALKVLMLDKNTEEIIQQFDSIKSAGKFLRVSAGHINEAAHGKRKTAYGYKWKIKGE